MPLITVFDPVEVQEGQYEVWEINVFDPVIAEDPQVPSLIFNVALEVSDSVLVREGQSDGPIPVILETVTLAEFVDIAMTRLNVVVSDNVTLAEFHVVTVAGVILPQPTVSDTVTVQEFLTVRMTVYIDVFDAIVGLDGARNMDVNDAVTVTDDLTLKLARLVVEVNDTITIADAVEVSGPGHNISLSDELLVAEAVTAMLQQLRPEAFTSVTVAEEVTVTLSSINLSPSVNEAVTVADAVGDIYTLPVQINEFTEVVTVESVSAITGILLANVVDAIIVVEHVAGAVFPMFVEASDAVAVVERVALTISVGRKAARDLPLVKVGR